MVNLTPSLSQVLVVPPFECAWLAGENFLLRDGTGCVSFEVKGESPLDERSTGCYGNPAMLT